MMLQILNKLKWKGGLKECKIIIKHRGAPKDEKVVSGSDVIEIKKGHFCYINNITKQEVIIPLHRVLSVEREGKILWQKREKKNNNFTSQTRGISKYFCFIGFFPSKFFFFSAKMAKC